jgi:hypothetical protein
LLSLAAPSKATPGERRTTTYALTSADKGRILEITAGSLTSLRLRAGPAGQVERADAYPLTGMPTAGMTCLCDPTYPVPRQLVSVIGCHDWPGPWGGNQGLPPRTDRRG